MPATACAGSSFRALGTRVSVLTTAPAALPAAEHLLRAQLHELDEVASRFRPTTEISRANAGAGHPVHISPLLAQLVRAALDVARWTAGAVDPTVGRAVSDLGYDRDFAFVPAAGRRLASRRRPAPGWHNVELDEDTLLLRVPAGTCIDLGSSAKAFAADRAATTIASALGTGVLVNLGGDIAVAGEIPAGGWAVGLVADTATGPGEEPVPVVSISSGGMASSGTAGRRWERGGERLHHIVDPRTGGPASSPWMLVTVAAGNCLVANAASTAAIVLGASGAQWLEVTGLPARCTSPGGEVTYFGGWPPDPGA